jgi:phosphate transport system permease protein
VKWFFRQQEFGALAMIYGSVAVSVVALTLAAPLGLGAAIFTAEYLPRRIRIAVKVLIELLAGVPSVVYGLWESCCCATGSISCSHASTAQRRYPAHGRRAARRHDPADHGHAQRRRSPRRPAAQRRAARALGLTRGEAILYIALPQARRGWELRCSWRSGARLARRSRVSRRRQAGQQPAERWLSLRPLLESGQTLTSKLGSSETNIAYGDPLHWAAIVGLGLILLLLTGMLTVLGTAFGKRSMRRTSDTLLAVITGACALLAVGILVGLVFVVAQRGFRR